ncbi:MAG: glycosyltransferase family 2 protein [Planctomycetota bacterium]
MTSDPTSPAARTPAPDLPDDVREGAFVVIAAYNEASCIADVAGAVRACYPHVVVVDDGSTDGTLDAALGGARYVLRHVVNRGQGAALQTGIEFALARGARFVVTFDADGQHRVEDVAAMLAPLARGECEITLGSRFLGGVVNLPWTRRLVLRLGVLFTRVVSRVQVTDAHNGFRAFTRRAAERITITADRMAHASEMIDLVRRTGLPFREVPVEIHYTDYSLAKGQSSRNALRIVFHYLLGRIMR